MSVDPKVAEYRRQMAARYAALPADEKPKVVACEHCQRPEHESRVCPVTGLLHRRDKMRLIGGVVVDGDKHQFNGRELMSALDAGRVKWQKARVQSVRIDSDASTFFQSFPLQRSWKLMRFGYMFGKYDEPNRRVSVHAIYEPPQEGNETGYRLGADARERTVELIAATLGLEHVGIIVTHQPRDSNEAVLSGTELLLAARDQSRFGDHCVIVTVAPDAATQQVTAQGWQTTEQCVRLFQMGTLQPSQQQLGFINSSIALEVAKDEKDAKGRPVCVVKEATHEIDCRFMTGYCAIEQFRSDIVENRFLRSDRPGERPIAWANVDAFFKDEKRVGKEFPEKMRDFHLLVFVVEQMLKHGEGFDDSHVKELIAGILKKDQVATARFEQWCMNKIKGR